MDTSQTTAQTTKPTDRRLGKHLLLIVIIKLLLLYGLWYGFIRPNKVKVTPHDIEQMYTSTGGRMIQNTSPAP